MIHHDARTLNAIVNHPEVLPGHLVEGQEGPLDVQPSLDRGGFCVSGEGYGFLMDRLGDGVYEVHTSILPEYRGQSYNLTRKAMAEVFVETDCREIVTRITANRPASKLASSCGMRHMFRRGETEYRVITLLDWAARASEYRAVGEAFHEDLELAGVETDHDEDGNHDQYVGIAIAMAMAGMINKAEWFYNTWARLTGFHPVTVTGPDTASFGIAEIKITPFGVEVL